MYVALAGGVGAARFLQGLVQVVPPEDVVIIGNTGDDEIFHGLHVSPDLDTVTYTLAGAVGDLGWGLGGDTFACLDGLGRYGVPAWFRLGDRDLATHLFRTIRLGSGAPLSEVTAEIARAWGLTTRLVPMSDDRVATRIVAKPVVGTATVDMAMQEWFVRERSEPPVVAVRFDGAETARPAPGVLEAIAAADVVFLCPSNPVISLGPILAVPGIRAALVARRDRVAGVSPIIQGATVKGPADRLMAAVGLDVSCTGAATAFADVCGTFLIDSADGERAGAIEQLGVRPVVTPILMRSPADAASMAQKIFDALP